MRSILLPTDLSDNANKALLYACNLFAGDGANIHLLHCYQNGEESYDLFNLETEIDDFISEEDELNLENITFEYEAVKGDPVEVIIDTANKRKVDMIIMGTRGAGKKHAPMGSNTTEVIRATTCPLLAVPEQAEYKPIKQLVFALDLEKMKNFPIHAIEKLASRYDGKLTLLHVNIEEGYLEPHKFQVYKELLNELPHDLKMEVAFDFVNANTAAEGINNYLTDHQADLLVMLTRQYHLIDKTFIKSLTRQMVFHSHIPILAFHE